MIRIEPLEHFPIERDLVIVMDGFMDKLKAVQPYLISKGKRQLSEGENLQTPLQLMAFKQYTLCINCLLCYAACPQCGLNEEFIGPAALALAHRYSLDSRDGGKDQRAEVVASESGIWECTFVGACSEEPERELMLLLACLVDDGGKKHLGVRERAVAAASGDETSALYVDPAAASSHGV